MEKPTFESRAIGTLVGLAIGDAMGAPVEGWSVDQIREKYSGGGFSTRSVVTDDTEYAIMTPNYCLSMAGVSYKT